MPVVVGSLPTTIVFGKLPNSASWQPALPGKKTMAATAAPLVVQSMATTGCAENRRPQFLRDNVSAVRENGQGRAPEIHPGGPPNFVMPARTSVWPVANAGYVWDATVAGNFFANERTHPRPESAPGKNAPAPRFFPPTKVVRAHRALRNIFAHSTIEKMQCNNFATLPPWPQTRANAQNPKSARVYS